MPGTAPNGSTSVHVEAIADRDEVEDSLDLIRQVPDIPETEREELETTCRTLASVAAKGSLSCVSLHSVFGELRLALTRCTLPADLWAAEWLSWTVSEVVHKGPGGMNRVMKMHAPIAVQQGLVDSLSKLVLPPPTVSEEVSGTALQTIGYLCKEDPER
eukprot:2591084-Prymnesium_polylepis.1